METKPFLLSVTLCGIKNIEKPITIDFYKNKGLRNFNSLNDKVRVALDLSIISQEKISFLSFCDFISYPPLNQKRLS